MQAATWAVLAALGFVVTLVAWVRAEGALGLVRRQRCRRCGAYLLDAARACAVCADGPEPPAPVRKARTIRAPSTGRLDPELGYVNGRLRRSTVRLAFSMMAVGLGVRVLGMLEPVGVFTAPPHWLAAALTIVGGIGAFVGFAVLDAA